VPPCSGLPAAAVAEFPDVLHAAMPAPTNIAAPAAARRMDGGLISTLISLRHLAWAWSLLTICSGHWSIFDSVRNRAVRRAHDA
jgi:hypothetical protein